MQQSQVETCDLLSDIACFLDEDGWNYENMKDEVSNHVVSHVRECMDFVYYEDKMDKPWLDNEQQRQVLYKKCLGFIWQREEENDNLKAIRIKYIPFKFFFITWRIWKGLILAVALMQSWKP